MYRDSYSNSKPFEKEDDINVLHYKIMFCIAQFSTFKIYFYTYFLDFADTKP